MDFYNYHLISSAPTMPPTQEVMLSMLLWTNILTFMYMWFSKPKPKVVIDGVTLTEYNKLITEYNELLEENSSLEKTVEKEVEDYNRLVEQHNSLVERFDELQEKNENDVDDYNKLVENHNLLLEENVELTKKADDAEKRVSRLESRIQRWF